MSIKQKIHDCVAPFYDKVWHAPKGMLAARIRKACDDIPQYRRLTVVTVLLSVFILTAFFVFGHACYRMGAGRARSVVGIEHIHPIDLPLKNTGDEAAR